MAIRLPKGDATGLARGLQRLAKEEFGRDVTYQQAFVLLSRIAGWRNQETFAGSFLEAPVQESLAAHSVPPSSPATRDTTAAAIHSAVTTAVRERFQTVEIVDFGGCLTAISILCKDGERRDLSWSHNPYPAFLSHLKKMSGFRVPTDATVSTNDARYWIEFEGRNIEVRVVSSSSDTPSKKTEIQILDPDVTFPRLETLGLSRRIDWSNAALGDGGGLLVVCGDVPNTNLIVRSTARHLAEKGKSLLFINDDIKSDAASSRLFPRSNLRDAGAKAVAFGDVDLPHLARAAFEFAKSGDVAIVSVKAAPSMMVAIRNLTATLAKSGVEQSELFGVLKGIMIPLSVPRVCQYCHGTGVECTNPGCNDSGVAGTTVVAECAIFRNADDLARQMNDLRAWSARSATHHQHTRDFGGVTMQTDIMGRTSSIPPCRPWPQLTEDAADQMATFNTHYDGLCAALNKEELDLVLEKRNLEGWRYCLPRRHHASQ
jgi:hypothetical protein